MEKKNKSFIEEIQGGRLYIPINMKTQKYILFLMDIFMKIL